MSERRCLSDLLRLCLVEGRADAWDMLVKYLQPEIVGVVARRAGRYGTVPADCVQNLTQNAYLKLCEEGLNLLRRIDGLEEEHALAYVKRAVKNLVDDHFRSEGSQTRYPPSGFADPEALDTASDTAPAEEIERRILIHEIDRILCSLLSQKTAARDRAIFWLRHRHGMTARAIAAIPGIGLSEDGVETLLRRIVLLLKKAIS